MYGFRVFAILSICGLICVPALKAGDGGAAALPTPDPTVNQPVNSVLPELKSQPTAGSAIDPRTVPQPVQAPTSTPGQQVTPLPPEQYNSQAPQAQGIPAPYG
ncbi:MAG: hypothetical protein WCH39_19055, partial [Schlesneria sp.]